MKRVNVPRLNTVPGPGPGSDEPTPHIIPGQQIQTQPGSGGVSIHGQQSQALALHENSPSHQATIIVSSQQVINYSKTGALQYAGAQYVPPKSSPASHMAPPIQHQPRHKAVVGTQSPGVQVAVGPLGGGGVNNYQRLKVEDALSYLDQVKYRFNNQPQVYNDFLDIMKEFKSQSIDTPGVIARVSNLFKGHPELIVGFNTFLPPGYKIEVQANDQGYAYQVSVSMPSSNSPEQQGSGVNVTHSGGQPVLGTTGILVGPPQTVAPQAHPPHNLIQILPGSTGNSIVHTLGSAASPSPSPGTGPSPAPAPSPSVPSTPLPSIPVAQPPPQSTNTLHHISQAHQQLEGPLPHSAQQPVEFNHAIEYVNKIKSRFSRQPEKYKRFLEILHRYQREQKELKEQPQVKQQTEQEVYAQVAKLFENQDDLLVEFGQFLPDATGSGNSVSSISGATIKSVTASLENNRSQDAIRPRTATQSQQRGGGGMDPMLMESESNFHSVSARPASPGYIMNSVTTGPMQTLPPRSQDASLPSHHPPVHHHQKHSSSTHHSSSAVLSSHHHLKRSPSFSNNQISSGAPPAKKHKLYTPRDVTLAEASKYGTLADFSFFDRVRKVVGSQEVYDNFIRCLLLFTTEIISKSELLVMTAPFFSKHPGFQRWMQEFLGPTSPPPSVTMASSPPISNGPHHYLPSAPAPAPVYTSGLYSVGGERYTGESDTLGALGAHMRQERPQGDAAMDVDLSTCKRLGTSYCALPKGSAESAARRCSGRTALCREVLNDSWVSFPTWAEDSTFVTSRKTQYEEYIYRCEDERFELDVVIETNASTILALEGVHKKLCRMSPEEAQRFRLDDCLGGSSPTIHQRALKRIYGDKAPDIIAGLKKNPLVAVPVVLRRLKSKEEEWREAQKGFNKQWREQNEKYYLKSLDHQGINFKQNDLKSLRSKSLINEIEALYEERREHMSRGQSISDAPHPLPPSGPHLCARLGAGGAALLTDATDLLIHHVRRQTAVQKQEKQRIKQILKHFLPDLFSHPRMPLSDDERDDDDKDVELNLDSPDSVNEDLKPILHSGSDKDVDMMDIKSSEMKGMIKQEREASSESDSNASPPEKIITRRPDKLSNKENKENIKSRNNSSQEAEDAGVWSKSSENNCNIKGSRRREGSSDSGSGKIKVEPTDTTPATDITFTSLNSLHKDKWTPPSSQGVVFYGSAHWYVFLRLHSVLCQRLTQMKQLADRLAQQEEGDSKLRKPATATALRLKPDNTLPVTQYYSALLEMVRSVLDGNMEATAYEDGLREMFGIHAFVAFTLDKIVSSAVRQLQQCVQERVASKCVDLHIQERARLGASGNATNPAVTASYQRRAEKLLKEEHAFKMCIYGGDDCRITFELLESGGATGMSGSGTGESRGACSGSGGGSSSPPPVPTASHSASSHITLPPTRLADWDMYRERFVNPGDSDTELYKDESCIGRKAVFLPRNVRRVKRQLNSNNGLSSSPHKSPSPVRDDNEKIEPTPINKQSYINADMQECALASGSLKPTFITYKDKIFYKCNALSQARKSHKKVTLRLDTRWQSWLRVWCSRHVTGAMSRGCAEWLRRGARAVPRGSPALPPYRAYTTYCLVHQPSSQHSPIVSAAAATHSPTPTPTPAPLAIADT